MKDFSSIESLAKDNFLANLLDLYLDVSCSGKRCLKQGQKVLVVLFTFVNLRRKIYAFTKLTIL